MSNGYLSVSGATLVWPIRDTEVSVYRVNTNGSYTLIGTSSSSSFSIVQYSGIVMQYAVSLDSDSDSESGYSNVVELYLPLTSDVSGIHGSEYLAAAMESTMTGEDIKAILHTHRDAFDSPVFTVAVSDTTKMVDTSTEAYDSILPFTVVLCKDGSAIDILASYIQNGELIYFAGSPGAILTYNILDDVSDPSDSTTRVSYYPDSELVVENIPGSTTVVVRIDDDLQGVTIAGVNYRLHSSGVMIPFGPNGLRVSLVGIGSWVSRTANSCTFSVSGTVAWLTGLNSSTGTLTVPASFTLSGVTYNVLGISGTLTNASFVSNLIFDASSTFTTIPASAFTGCTNLSSITLPPGITTIGDNAFSGLTNFRTITNLSAIPLTSIGYRGFYNCTRLTGTLPSTITNIGSEAFRSTGGSGGGLVCPTLFLQSLGASAFQTSSISGSFDVSGLTAIPNSAFSSAINIRNLYNTQNLTSIGVEAFANCHRLIASFSSSLTSIGGSAFVTCGAPSYVPSATMTGLLTFAPMSLSSLGVNAFNTCANLSGSIDFSNSSLTTLPSQCFIECRNLTSVKFSSAITTLDTTVFRFCVSLSNISFYPNSQLRTIGAGAFRSCARLTGTLPSTITNIGNDAFFGTGGSGGGLDCPTLCLQSLGTTAFQNSSISGSFDVSGLTAIPTSAFDAAINIRNVYNTQNLTTIAAGAFANCHRLVASFPSSLTSISGNAFICCGAPGYVPSATMTGLLTFAPMSLSFLGTNAFNTCANLSGSIDFSNSSFTTFTANAFIKCINLTSITMPPLLNSIGDNAFDECVNLTTIPNIGAIPLTTLGIRAFRFCHKLVASFPSSITDLGTQAFRACGSPNFDPSSTMKGLLTFAPMSLRSLGTLVFNHCVNLSGSIDFSNSSITTFPDRTFTLAKSLQSVKISSAITRFQDSFANVSETGLFELCSSLSNISFYPNSQLSYIGFRAFYNCPNLTGTLPSTITDISAVAFYNCSLSGGLICPTLKLRTLGASAFYNCGISGSFDISGVTAIPMNALYGAYNIQTIYNAQNLTYISDAAFYGCTSLTTITNIEASPLTYIGYQAFQGCILLPSLSLPSTVTDISNDAFLNCSGSMTIVFAGLPPVLTTSGSLNTTTTMYGVYPSTLENQWLPLISGGLFRNLRMRSSQMRIAMTTTAQSIYNLSSVVFSLSGTPNTVYSIYDASALCVSGNMISTTMLVIVSGISEGSHSFYVTLTDVIGNIISSTPIILMIDTIVPAAPVLSGAPTGAIQQRTVTIGISGEFGTTYHIYTNGSLNASGTLTAGTTYTLSDLADASYSVYATLTDSAGNMRSSSSSRWSVYTPVVYVPTDSAITFVEQILTTMTDPVVQKQILIDNAASITTPIIPLTTVNIASLLTTSTTTFAPQAVSMVLPNVDISSSELPDASASLYLLGNTGSSIVYTVDGVSSTVVFGSSSVTINDVTTPVGQAFFLFDRIYLLAGCGSAFITSLVWTADISGTSTRDGSANITWTDLTISDNFVVEDASGTVYSTTSLTRNSAMVTNLQNGPNTFYVRAYYSGNPSGTVISTDSITLLGDMYPPAAPILSGPPSYINVSGTTIGISGEVGTFYNLYLDNILNASGTIVSGTSVSLFDLFNGLHTVYVTLNYPNAIQIISSSIITWTVDTVNPLPPILTPTPSQATETITISGEAGTTYVLTLTDTLTNIFTFSGVMVDGGVQYSYNNLFYTQPYTLTATLIDADFNQSAPTSVSWTPPFTLSVSGSTLIWNGPDAASYSLVRVNTDSSTTVIDTPSNASYDISRYVGLTIAYRADTYSNTTANASSNVLTVTLSPTDYPPTAASIPPTEYITAGLQSATLPATLKGLLDDNGVWFSSNLTTISGLDCSVLIDPSRCSQNYPVEYFANKVFTFAMMYADASFQSADFPIDASSVLYIAIPSNTYVSIQIDGTIYTMDVGYTLNIEHTSFTVLNGDFGRMYGLNSIFSLQCATYIIGAFGCVACIPYIIYTPTNVRMDGSVISWTGSAMDVSYTVYDTRGDVVVGSTSNTSLDISINAYPFSTYYVVGMSLDGTVSSAPSSAVPYLPPPTNLTASGDTVLSWTYPEHAYTITFDIYTVGGIYIDSTQSTSYTLITPLRTTAYMVNARTATSTSDYSTTVTITILDPSGGGNQDDDPLYIPCFLGSAPVLTPTGYAKISKLTAGDTVLTADGRTVRIQRVLRKTVAAGPSTNPYTIPKGVYGATCNLAISPNHRVVMSDGSMVEARCLGLRQSERIGVIEYYNLELPDWKHDNMVVAGVAVESLAPVRRMSMTIGEFKKALLTKYGSLTPAIMAKITKTCRMLPNGRVDCPVLPA